MKLANPLLLSARAHTKEARLDYRNAWGKKLTIISLAKSYVKSVQDKAIVLKRETDGLLKIIPYYTRFSDGYYKKAIKKIRSLYAKDAVFLTLTIDPKRFISLAHAYDDLQRNWNRLLTMLRKRWGTLRFLKIIEFQKNGSPHLHALFLGQTRLIDANELREFWDKKYGVGVRVHLKKIQNDYRQVVAYLCSYFKKTLEEIENTEGDCIGFTHTALAWSLQLRAFSTSRGILVKRLLNNSNENWLYLGCFPLIEVCDMDGKLESEVQWNLDRLRNEHLSLDEKWLFD